MDLYLILSSSFWKKDIDYPVSLNFVILPLFFLINLDILVAHADLRKRFNFPLFFLTIVGLLLSMFSAIETIQ